MHLMGKNEISSKNSIGRNEEYHICLSTDDNYSIYCGVTICSLFENNPDSQFVIHIIINKLHEDNIAKLKSIAEKYNSKILFHKVDSSKLEGCKYREYIPLTEAAYYRLLLSSILPDVKKALYLDCDIIVNGTIDELFKIELDNYPLAAVKDPGDVCEERRNQLSIPYGEAYFNSGVLLINLDYWRRYNVETKLLEFAKRERRVYFHDQDALNYVFKGKWYSLSPKWNKSNYTSMEKIVFFCKEDEKAYVRDARIIHYSSDLKPWYKIYGTKYRKLYKKFAKISQCEDKNPIRRRNKVELYIKVLNAKTRDLLYKLGLLKWFHHIKIHWFNL